MNDRGFIEDPTRRRPEIFGYEFGSVLGRGGNAVVYAATQLSVNRQVAIKIDSRPMHDERNQRRFLREATASARISGHPHVVSLIDAGITDQGFAYLVMERCDGGSLLDLMQSGPLPAADVVELGLAASSGLGAAHDAGILHRDIKPANILVDAFGTPRLSDFGISAMPVPGQELSVTIESLTPAYAAPEVFRGVEPTAAADVWSMGATLHALLCGTPPRRDASGNPAPIGEIIARLFEPLADPGLPGSDLLMPLIWRATDPDPARRYPDGAALWEALHGLRNCLGPAKLTVGGVDTSVRFRQPLAVAPRRSRSRGVAAVLLAAALGTASGVVGTALLQPALTAGSSPANQPSAPSANSTPEPSFSVPSTRVPSPSARSPGQSSSTARASAGAPGAKAGTCFGGLVTIAGKRTATVLPCNLLHSWESYAVGELEASTESVDLDLVADDSKVKETCTAKNLKAYGAKRGSYSVEVLPPSEFQFAHGNRWFHCVAAPQGGGMRTGSLRSR